MTGEAIAFWLLGGIAVFGAIGVVAAPKAVYSALSLASTMIDSMCLLQGICWVGLLYPLYFVAVEPAAFSKLFHLLQPNPLSFCCSYGHKVVTYGDLHLKNWLLP